MKIGLLGMGTIGSGVYEIARNLPDVEVKWVLEKRFQADYITDDIAVILQDPQIELVVETMGGLHPALEFAEAVLGSGRHFVTANKLLVSTYGPELTALARKQGVAFLYGAACGGGIAYLANLALARELDRITALGGILNGTTNYILDAMQAKGGDYATALAEAQALGYAERDPSSDVDGLDTQRKLVLSCAVGFGVWFPPEEIPTRGIASVLPSDVARAQTHGRVIRLCAVAERAADGRISARVEPTLVSRSDVEASICSNVNYAWYEGEHYGLMGYVGQGAGKLPTASNVLRDVRSVCAGARYMTAAACAPVVPDNSTVSGRYYLRVPAGTSLPAGWAEQTERSGGWDVCLTRPVCVAEMHARMAELPSAFFAGIREADDA